MRRRIRRTRSRGASWPILSDILGHLWSRAGRPVPVGAQPIAVGTAQRLFGSRRRRGRFAPEGVTWLASRSWPHSGRAGVSWPGVTWPHKRRCAVCRRRTQPRGCAKCPGDVPPRGSTAVVALLLCVRRAVGLVAAAVGWSMRCRPVRVVALWGRPGTAGQAGRGSSRACSPPRGVCRSPARALRVRCR